MAKQDRYTISVLRSNWTPMYDVPRGTSPLHFAQEYADKESVKEVSIYRNGRYVRSVYGPHIDHGVIKQNDFDT